MKKQQTSGTGRSIAKERSGRGLRRNRCRPGLELLEVRQTPAVFGVNTLLDTVAVNLQTGTDAQGHISLRSAIMAANARPGADTILLPNGTFKLTIPGAGEDAAATGDLDIRGDITITGRGHTGTVIDGNRLDRVFQVLSGNATFSQLTIQGGSNPKGGGLLNSGGRVTLSGVFVQNNEALGAAGADGANGVPGVSTPTNGQNGGDAAGGGVDNASGSLALVDSTVTDNQAIGGKGGRGGVGADHTGADGVPSTDITTRTGHDAGGGVGATGGRGGLAQGGGVFNAPGASLTLSHSRSGRPGLGRRRRRRGPGRHRKGRSRRRRTELWAGDRRIRRQRRRGAGGAGGTAGLGEGGGLYNGGQVTLSGSENDFIDNEAGGGAGGEGGVAGEGAGGRGGNGSQPGQVGSSAGGLGGFGIPGQGGVGAPGAAGLGGGVYNASGAVLTSSGQVGFSANLAIGGQGGAGGRAGFALGGTGGDGRVSQGGSGGLGATGGHGGLGGQGEGGGLFNVVGGRASFTAPATNPTRETVALFANNSAIAGQGGAGGQGSDSQGGFGGNGVFGSPALPSHGGLGGPAEGGTGGVGGDGGLAAGAGFANAGNLSFTGITLNANTNQVVAGSNGSGGQGGSAVGGDGGNADRGGTGDRGGDGGDAVGGSGGNAGNAGNAFGGGGFNAPTGVLFIDPRQGAPAGSAQSRARSLIRFNQALPGSQSVGGSNGRDNPGGPGIGPIDGHFGTSRSGSLGSPGLPGQDRGGGLYLSPGGTVTLRNTLVTLNQATTSDPDISGTFSQ